MTATPARPFSPLSQTKPKLAEARHSSPLRRQLGPSLLRHHVRGIPFGPVLVALPSALFVLSVGSFCTPKRARQIVGRREGRRRGVDATGQPGCELLEQPTVAVRIMERGERAVAAMLGIRTADPEPPKQVRFVRTGVHTAGVVKHLADLYAATKQLFAGGLDVGNDQVQALGGARCGRGDILAEDDRTPGAWRCKLDHAEVFTVVEVSVEAPPELPTVEFFGAIDIRNGDDNYLELHIHFRGDRFAGRVVTTDFSGAHGSLLCWVECRSSKKFILFSLIECYRPDKAAHG